MVDRARALENERRYKRNHKSLVQDRVRLANWRKYGIVLSLEEYYARWDKQNGLCAICRGTCFRALAADHDHETKKFRGLLCSNCNRALGLFKDSVLVLERAVAYLKGD